MNKTKFLTIVLFLVLAGKWDVLQSFFELYKSITEDDQNVIEAIYQSAENVRSKIDAAATQQSAPTNP